MYVKVLKIRAEDSPNVRLAIAQMRRGDREPDPILIRTAERPWGCWTQDQFEFHQARWREKGCPNPPFETVVPGVLTFPEYKERRLNLSPQEQAPALDGWWYEGPEVKLFPLDWLLKSRELGKARSGAEYHGRQVKQIEHVTNHNELWMGVDVAEGGDLSVWEIGNRLGSLKLIQKRTPNTNVVALTTIELIGDYKIPPENVMFDRGGGGKEHVDRLRAAGFAVRDVAFGETLKLDMKRGKTMHHERVELRDDQTLYRTRRIEMYWEAANLFNPASNPQGFALPPEVADSRFPGRKTLFEQLELIPKEYDKDGRPYLRPKTRDPGQDGDGRQLKTLVELIGHSPDEADAFVLRVHVMLHRPTRLKAGVL